MEVLFEVDGAQPARVALEHRSFEHHREGAAAYRSAMASDQGWPFILSRYVQAAS